jgi:chromosome partitioning protein
MVLPLKVAFANHKGGVGKSLVTAQAAAALARLGLNVLVIDFDPQANVTRRLGLDFDPENPFASISEAILAAGADEPMVGAVSGAVLQCGWRDDTTGELTAEAERIWVVPARFDLDNRESESGVLGAVHRLQIGLEGEWIEFYDVVLIDCRPSLGHIVQMALCAADVAIAVTDAEVDGVEGVIRLAEFIEKNRRYLDGIELRGIIVNQWRDVGEHFFQLEGLQDKFGDLVWAPKVQGWDEQGRREEFKRRTDPSDLRIPDWIRNAEASGAAASLSAYTDARGRETTAIFDHLANRMVDELIPAGRAA